MINYDELDPGIRETVRWLNDHMYRTTDSGDGVTKLLQALEYGNECEALPYPHVFMVCSPEMLVQSARRLLSDLRSIGVTVGPVDRDGVFIQATYDPANETGIIELVNLNDELLLEKLK